MRRHMFRWSPARIIAGAFGSISFIGSILLYLPWGHMPGQSITYVDALYTAVSALCVTGLSIVDTAAVFNPFGQAILAVLIQVGGLGVSTMGAGVLLMLGRKVGIRQRNLIHDTMNLDSYSGVVRFLRTLFATTVFIEIIGAFLGYFVFRRDYEMMESIGLSIFHSISSFNNAGLTILTKERSMEMYAEDPFMLILTTALVFVGGLGFIVIRECWVNRFRWRKLSMHSRVSIFMAVFLLIGGAVLLIGTSTGSTGGGVKTSTVFALVLGVRRVTTNARAEAFHYSLPPLAFRKAAVVVVLAIADIVISTFILLLVCPELSLAEAFTEMMSAFTTVGLSLGTTASLNEWGKLISILVMLTGRMGPMTIATAWYFYEETRARYPEGNVTVG